MKREILGGHFERIGLFLGGAFVALGAQMRGWVEYSLEMEFWLIPIILGCVFFGQHLRRNFKGDIAEAPDSAVKS